MTPVGAVSGTVARRALVVRGVVQGVGFRPFVYGLARRLGLHGFVGNDSAQVFIEVEGPPEALATFERALVAEAPPLAVIDEVVVTDAEPTGCTGFAIVASRVVDGAVTLVPPDVATCDDCLAELFDPTDRRFRYPFVNCTSCGPRFTIIRSLPYDRPATTMAGFEMCPACEAEYHDPADRRFHAQPVACPACGPQLVFAEGALAAPSAAGDGALAAAQRRLAAGDVVAVKGLGGYHLACDATDAVAVARLRERKGRVGKPFALLAPDLHAVRRFAVVSKAEADLLRSPARPIVLLRKRADGSPVAANVAPGNGWLGVMLPYTPLHHLLVRPGPDGHPVPDVLVLTSGNLTDEPIAYDDADARRRLAGLADAFLTHDRPIHMPCDDSVVRVVDGAEQPIRRSRGYAPYPVRLTVAVPPVLAAGGELKTTFCLAEGHHAWLSQHLGDMGALETLRAFERSVEQFAALYRVRPMVVAADAHPGYLTSRWAERYSAHHGVPLVRVQHHRAHVASLLAEHGLAPSTPVLAFAFDGTGYGDDDTIWGGEVFLGGPAGLYRAAHLGCVALPGGDASIERPYRSALAHLRAAGITWDEALAPVAACAPVERGVLARQLDTGLHTVATSSMGRLFDAVASLAEVRQEASYEAQAAIELEALVDAEPDHPYAFGVIASGEVLRLDPAPVVRAVVDDVIAGRPAPVIAARFHAAVADAVHTLADALRRTTGLDLVGLTGGVFQNATLTTWTSRRLRDAGFTVLAHRRVPPNDGGLALGQAVLAAAGRS